MGMGAYSSFEVQYSLVMFLFNDKPNTLHTANISFYCIQMQAVLKLMIH